MNSVVDTLLKKEFDIHRAHNTAHPLMDAYGLKNLDSDDLPPSGEDCDFCAYCSAVQKHEKHEK